jgi:hypothetical protein
MIEKKLDKYIEEMAVMKPSGGKYEKLYKLIGYKEASMKICEFCADSAVYGQTASGKDLKECMRRIKKRLPIIWRVLAKTHL